VPPEAQNILTELYYISETRFTFEQYITKLSEAFEVLQEQHDFGKSEPEKVFILLAGIKCDNPIITAATTAVRMIPEQQSNDFRKASEALSEWIGSLFVMSPTGRLAARIVTTEQVTHA
jgi:hypothetical protein